MSTDSEIIATSDGRPAAFAELYERHARAVYRYAARRTDAGVAEDILSETFLVAFERRAAYDASVPSALPWLLGIATTLIRKRSRVEARAWRGMLADHHAASVTADQVEQLGIRVDAEAAVRRLATVLKRMRREDRDVLLLYAWGHLTYEQIAAALEIPIGTVRSRLNRTRRSLRAALDRADARDTEVEHGRADTRAQLAQ